MSYLVLVYSRREGRLVREPETFPSSARAEALARRFEVERELRDHQDYEVVVLGGESEGTIRRTHARYFSSPADILASGQ